MPNYELEVTMNVTVEVEADSRDEAETLVHDGLVNLDSSQFESVDVCQIDTESVTNKDDDEDPDCD